uniref:Uncharacterized protein n=1 Tax=Candidatus Kentrum sp. LFY TaxID=2126342 RepID=A0A450V2L8_9GAMM|nr:MAG: hypothetical protein BECKLFY1418A_GA0070994_109114 [Candidatus Kentron sp. LFY]
MAASNGGLSECGSPPTGNKKCYIIRLLETSKPLPDNGHSPLFEDKRKAKLIWNGKTNEVCNPIAASSIKTE